MPFDTSSPCIDIPRDLDAFEQLVHFLLTQLLTETSEHVFELTLANESIALLVKHLEPTNELV